MFKEILACVDGGPTPPSHMDVETAHYVGVYDEAEGTIIGEFFADWETANRAFNRLDIPTEG